MDVIYEILGILLLDWFSCLFPACFTNELHRVEVYVSIACNFENKNNVRPPELADLCAVAGVGK